MVVETRFLSERLAPVLAEAQARAASLGRPVLAGRTTALDADLLPRPPLPTSLDYFFWEQPSRDVSYLALGDACSLTARGAGRFETVRRELAGLRDGAVHGGEGEIGGPLAFAGFAFDATSNADAMWREFPDALVTVPRLLFRREGAVSSLSMNVLVDATSDLPALLASIENDLARYTSSAASSETQAPPSLACAPSSDHERWLESVRSLTDAIGAGETEKVVLARRLEVEAARPFVVESVLERLRQRYRDCTLFAVRRGDTCFLGATPETLVRFDGRTVRTDCLAGSAARGRSDEEDRAIGEALLADDKERHEHALVVRALSEALIEACGEVRTPATPRLRRMANVQHLHTPIQAVAPVGLHVLDLVQRLHPTPATGGLPRERALCLIHEHEPFSRGWYAGPIGWLDAQGNGEFAVALRSALVHDTQASLYAGCGIVRGSDPEREYQESRIKLEAMLWALGGKS